MFSSKMYFVFTESPATSTAAKGKMYYQNKPPKSLELPAKNITDTVKLVVHLRDQQNGVLILRWSLYAGSMHRQSLYAGGL